MVLSAMPQESSDVTIDNLMYGYVVFEVNDFIRISRISSVLLQKHSTINEKLLIYLKVIRHE